MNLRLFDRDDGLLVELNFVWRSPLIGATYLDRHLVLFVLPCVCLVIDWTGER